MTTIPGAICPKCQWSDFFKAQVCPRCLTALVDTTFPGQGRIVTFTVIRYPPVGFEGKPPYVVALVDLNSGPRVVARIDAKPEAVKIDALVDFAQQTEGALEFVLD